MRSESLNGWNCFTAVSGRISSSTERWSFSSKVFIDQSADGNMSTGKRKRYVAVFFIVVQTWGLFIRQKLSRF